MIELLKIFTKIPGFVQYKPLLRLSYSNDRTMQLLTIANQGSNTLEIKTIRRITPDGRVETCKYGTAKGWVTSPITIPKATAVEFIVHLGPTYYETDKKYGYLVSLTDGTVFFKNHNLPYLVSMVPAFKALTTEVTRARYTF